MAKSPLETILELLRPLFQKLPHDAAPWNGPEQK